MGMGWTSSVGRRQPALEERERERGIGRGREREKERKGKREAEGSKATSETELKHWCILWLSLFLSMPPIQTPATCIHTLRYTFARAHRPQSQTVLWYRFCVPSPSLYYPVTREAYKPNKRINGGRIPWPSNLSPHLFCFPRYLSFYTCRSALWTARLSSPLSSCNVYNAASSRDRSYCVISIYIKLLCILYSARCTRFKLIKFFYNIFIRYLWDANAIRVKYKQYKINNIKK